MSLEHLGRAERRATERAVRLQDPHVRRAIILIGMRSGQLPRRNHLGDPAQSRGTKLER